MKARLEITTETAELASPGKFVPQNESLDKAVYKNLFLACYLTNASMITDFLKNPNAKINEPNKLGETALAVACQTGEGERHLEIIKTLIANGADVNIADNQGNTPLLTACKLGYAKVLLILLEHGADVNATNKSGETPTAIAQQSTNKNLLKILQTHKPNTAEYWINRIELSNASEYRDILAKISVEEINTLKTSKGYTLLDYYGMQGNIIIVALFLQLFKNINLNTIGPDEKTVLMRACEKKGREFTTISKLLIENRAQLSEEMCGDAIHNDHKVVVDALANSNFASILLYYACRFGKIDLVKRLLSMPSGKIDVNYRETIGNETGTHFYMATPLQVACSNKNLEIINLLLQHKEIDVFATTTEIIIKEDKSKTEIKHYIFHSVCRPYNNTEIVKSFLTHGKINKDNIDHRNYQGATALHLTKDSKVAELLLMHGADINVVDDKDNNPLHHACNSVNRDLAEFLIKNKIDINKQNQSGHTPLILATMKGSLDIVELLLKGQACLTTRNKHGRTALFYALATEGPELTKLLLQHGASFDEIKDGTFNALTLAISLENIDIFKYVLGKMNDVNEANTKGTTPLMFALQADDKEIAKEIIELLLEKGANLKAVNHSGESVASLAYGVKELFDFLTEKKERRHAIFCSACEHGHLNIVKALVKGNGHKLIHENNGEAFLLACQHGQTDIVAFLLTKYDREGTNLTEALFIACENGHDEIVKLLIENNTIGDIDKKFKNKTLMYLACENGHSKIVNFLLSQNANANKGCTDENQTPLHIACKNGHNDVVTLLIDHGVHLNKKSKAGDTPLLLAHRHGQTGIVNLLMNAKKLNPTKQLFKACKEHNAGELISLLIEQGAEVNATKNSGDGDTPLLIACRNGRIDAVAILLANGAKVNQKSDESGIYPLYVAAQAGHEEIVAKLIDHGADCRLKNTESGKMALDVAKTDAIRKLLGEETHAIKTAKVAPTKKGKQVKKDAEKSLNENTTLLNEFSNFFDVGTNATLFSTTKEEKSKIEYIDYTDKKLVFRTVISKVNSAQENFLLIYDRENLLRNSVDTHTIKKFDNAVRTARFITRPQGQAGIKHLGSDTGIVCDVNIGGKKYQRKVVAEIKIYGNGERVLCYEHPEKLTGKTILVASIFCDGLHNNTAINKNPKAPNFDLSLSDIADEFELIESKTPTKSMK